MLLFYSDQYVQSKWRCCCFNWVSMCLISGDSNKPWFLCRKWWRCCLIMITRCFLFQGVWKWWRCCLIWMFNSPLVMLLFYSDQYVKSKWRCCCFNWISMCLISGDLNKPWFPCRKWWCCCFIWISMSSSNDDVVVSFGSVGLSATLLHECLVPDTRSVQLYCMSAWRQTLTRCNLDRWNFTAWMSGARHSVHPGELYCIVNEPTFPSLEPDTVAQPSQASQQAIQLGLGLALYSQRCPSVVVRVSVWVRWHF